jgi:hypothetical protein
MIRALLVIALISVAAQGVCKPKLEIGMSYMEAKVACTDLAAAPFDRDAKTNQVFFLCPSQHTVIIGDLRTTRMVGFMLTPEWQDTLRLKAARNPDSARADFAKDDSVRRALLKQRADSANVLR